MHGRAASIGVGLRVDDEAATRAVLTEMEDLLREVVSSPSPPRTIAVRYTRCRDALLASSWRSLIPGFIVQCVSISKFQDFISLYDPAINEQLAFLRSAFGRGEARSRATPRPDASIDFNF